MTVDTSTERLRGMADELLHGADQSALMAWEGLTERQRRAAEILLAIAEERDRLVAERDAAKDALAVAVAKAEAAAEKAKDAEAEQDGVRDSAVDFVFTVLEKALGVTKWSPCDGTETRDGDVQGSVYELLYVAKVLDPETGERVTDRLAAVEAERDRLVAERGRINETLRYAWGKEIGDVLTKLIAAEADAARLREALEPFAEFADHIDGITLGFGATDEFALCPVETDFELMRITLDKFQAARAARTPPAQETRHD